MIFLLDSSALINNPSFFFEEGEEYFVTAKIMDEFKEFNVRHFAENALRMGEIKIQNPSPKTEERVREIVAAQGFKKLSEADVSLIALALELKEKSTSCIVLTDDYSIQNFLSLLEIPFEGAVHAGIKEAISFTKYCPACSKEFSKSFLGKECPVCGTSLKKTRKKAGAALKKSQNS